MKNYIMISLLTIAGLQAHAERLPATQFGLTPETGYLYAVTEDEKCDSRMEVRLTKPGGDPILITKCDGSMIGWVTRMVLPDELKRDRTTLDPHDHVIISGIVYDRFENDSINIYTCDESRADELQQFPNPDQATDAQEASNQLQALKDNGQASAVQLFFNQYVYSGKCIGSVKPMEKAARVRAKFLRFLRRK